MPSFIQKHCSDVGGVLSVANTLITVVHWWIAASWNNLSHSLLLFDGEWKSERENSAPFLIVGLLVKDVMDLFTARKQDIRSQIFRLQLEKW